jgi:multisubunit Na+/H+ antiporter MnhB subunit
MSEGDSSTVAGLILSILIFCVLLFTLYNFPFPVSNLITNQMTPIKPGSNLGPLMSRFLWDYRGLDLTFQTILLFATAISVLSQLRSELKE